MQHILELVHDDVSDARVLQPLIEGIEHAQHAGGNDDI